MLVDGGSTRFNRYIMAGFRESAPYQGAPDEFDLLVCDLEEQIEDPYLIAIHRKALFGQHLANQHDGEEGASMRKGFIRDLDSEWRYMNELIHVTGEAVVIDADEGTMVDRNLIDEHAVSRGFTFYRSAANMMSYVARLVEIDAGKGDGTMTQAALMLDNKPQLSLPYPSPELRDKRFRYFHALDAAFIDELAVTARRQDQIIKDYAEYVLEADPANRDDYETILDAAQYLKNRADLDPRANYGICISDPNVAFFKRVAKPDVQP